MADPLFQIKKEKQTEKFGLFIIEPLKQGYGHTLGTALRRVLLSDMPGAAVTQVKISGVKHQFSVLKGLKEDILELILNLKKIRIKYQGDKPVKLSLEAKGPGEVKAGSIKTPAEVEVVNSDFVIGHLANSKSLLKMELQVECGVGYLSAEDRKSETVGVIPVDAAFSPVKLVNYRVESTRVGRRTDLDRLVLEITTDGTIAPSKAFDFASKILVSYFQQIVTPKKAPKKKEEKTDELPMAGDLTVEELDLPTRIVNALRKGGYGDLKSLASANRADLSKVKNLGEKSVKVIEAALAQKNVTLKG